MRLEYLFETESELIHDICGEVKGARIARTGQFAPDVLRCKLDEEYGGVNLRMSHQVLEGGQ